MIGWIDQIVEAFRWNRKQNPSSLMKEEQARQMHREVLNNGTGFGLNYSLEKTNRVGTDRYEDPDSSMFSGSHCKAFYGDFYAIKVLGVEIEHPDLMRYVEIHPSNVNRVKLKNISLHASGQWCEDGWERHQSPGRKSVSWEFEMDDNNEATS
jgi:hypothetical protein